MCEASANVPPPPTAAFKWEEPKSVSQVARWDGALSSLQLYGEVVPHVGGTGGTGGAIERGGGPCV